MMEAKGARGRLCKLDKHGRVELAGKDGKRAAVTDFAVNGAVHYANAILDGGEYQEVLAIGLNGWEEREELKRSARYIMFLRTTRASLSFWRNTKAWIALPPPTCPSFLKN